MIILVALCPLSQTNIQEHNEFRKAKYLADNILSKNVSALVNPSPSSSTLATGIFRSVWLG